MTIAIALKIGDGVVLGADSAVTLAAPGHYPDNVYFNAEKIIHLVKALPLGAVTYGLGGFGGRSVTRLARDLRRRLSDPADPWWLDPARYTVEEAATRVKEFFYDELYRAHYPDGGVESGFGFLVCGYSSRSTRGEVWSFEVDENGGFRGPYEAIEEETGLAYRGYTDVLSRLIRGVSEETVRRLVGERQSTGWAYEMLETEATLWRAAMPVHDGIDLVRYLVEVVAGYVRYSTQPATVAPPADLAVITRHEGFRWVARKHYYPSSLNPMTTGGAT